MGGWRRVMTKPSVIFCADARPTAGGGHMGRCINLARALQGLCDVGFVLDADAAPQWRKRLRAEDIAIVDDGIRNRNVVTVLDHYELSLQAIAGWKHQSCALVLIEDLGRCFADVDLYVAFAGPASPGARVLAGAQYALLNADYARPVTAPAEAGRILVTCGLGDFANVTGMYLDALARSNASDIKAISVVLGAAAPHRESVARQAQSLGARALFDVQDMATLYDDADVVLGAGGVSLFERMARGRASVTIVAAANQAYAAAQMAKLGGTLLAGDVESVDSHALAQSIGMLLSDRNGRVRMGEIARQSVDGLGATRVAHEITTLASQARPAAAVAGH
jgi:UDP-2,4-diacetamido-2,4,6-trideoxy-beta-L-altropyranose hydrolase